MVERSRETNGELSFENVFPTRLHSANLLHCRSPFLCLEHVHHWERIASRGRPAFSSQSGNTALPENVVYSMLPIRSAVLVLRETNPGRHFAQSKALARIWNSKKPRAYLRSINLGNPNFHCIPFCISAIVDGIRSCRGSSFLQNPVCRLRWGDGILEPQGFGCSSAPRRPSGTGVS